MRQAMWAVACLVLLTGAYPKSGRPMMPLFQELSGQLYGVYCNQPTAQRRALYYSNNMSPLEQNLFLIQRRKVQEQYWEYISRVIGCEF